MSGHKTAECAKLYEEFEYRKDALQAMFRAQANFQTQLAAKGRSKEFPLRFMEEGVNEAAYNWLCVCVEYREAQEWAERALDHLGDRDKIEECRLECAFEWIDMWHFLMNAILFLGSSTPDFSLGNLFDEASERQTKHKCTTAEVWSHLTEAWSALIDSLPYKKWKRYEGTKIVLDDMLLYNVLVSFIQMGIIWEVDEKEMWNLYESKHKENRNRQKEGGKYA